MGRGFADAGKDAQGAHRRQLSRGSGAAVARRHCKDTKHPSGPSWTGCPPCFSLFPKALRLWLAAAFPGKHRWSASKMQAGSELALYDTG